MVLKKSLISILIIGAFTSCSKKPSPVNGSVKIIKNLISSQNACWTNFPETIKNYFSSELTKRQFNDFWLCVDNSITLFTSYLDDKGEGKYSHSDIKNILSKVFIDQMVAKKVISIFDLLQKLSFFREGEFLYKKDIKLLKRTIATLKSNFIKLYPHREVLFFSTSSSYSEYLKATKVLSKVFNSVGGIFAKNNTSYSYQELDAFLQIFSEKHLEITKFVFAAKTFLIQGKKKVISNQEWIGLSSLLANIYSTYRGFQLFFLNSNAPSFSILQSQFKYFQLTENKVLKILNKQQVTVNGKSEGYLIQDINNLIINYKKMSHTKVAVSSQVINSLWKNIHILLDKNKYSKFNWNLDKKVFSKKHFLSFKSLVLRWFYVQNLNLNFLDFSDKSLFFKDKILVKYKTDLGWEVDLLEIKKTFIELITKKIGKQQVDEKGRLLFSNTYNVDFLWNNLARLNQESLLVDLVFSAYSGSDTKMNIEELVNVFDQVKPITTLTQLPNFESKEIAKTIYFQANLFMPSSQFDKGLDKQEVLEYAHYILSGLSIQNTWVDLASKHCMPYKNNGAIFYKTTCVYKQFLNNQKQYFCFLGREKQLGFLTNPEEWFVALAVAAGHKQGQMFNKQIMFKMGMLLQYIITIFDKVDFNQDFQLSYFESLEFFPVIKEALQSFLPIKDTLELQNLYTYTLKSAGLPDYNKDPLAALKVLSWSIKEDKQYKVSFFELLKVFKSLQGFSI